MNPHNHSEKSVVVAHYEGTITNSKYLYRNRDSPLVKFFKLLSQRNEIKEVQKF